MLRWRALSLTFFFFNDTATTEIYTLSLHDALPISGAELPDAKTEGVPPGDGVVPDVAVFFEGLEDTEDDGLGFLEASRQLGEGEATVDGLERFERCKALDERQERIPRVATHRGAPLRCFADIAIRFRKR